MFNLEFIRKVDPGEGENFKKLKSWEYIRRKQKGEKREEDRTLGDARRTLSGWDWQAGPEGECG